MKIFNSMTRKKEEFVPVHPGEARIYACGPTVYNYFHIGNARPFIVFDTLRRYLEYRGYKVTFVQNFTDIDDKMIKAANEQGITVKQLGEHFIEEYFKDAKGLNIRPATVHPKATEHIEDIIRLISRLIEEGHAYVAENGDVYYDTESFKDYGKLSGQDLDDLEMGARIEVNDVKKNPMDFALWKAKKPGEPAWESPFSEGRPGWHIECSAMSQKYLGDTFDIHGGGQDLKFPHHENEIAQSEGATGKTFANYWMHNGYINIDNRKMSKSLGNFFTVRDISKEFDLLAVRLFMLSSHYRNPINFSRDLIVQAEAALSRIANCRENLRFVAEAGKSEAKKELDLESFRQRFIDAMDDDLNTADAIGVIFDLVKELNTAFSQGGDAAQAKEGLGMLDELLGVLGFIKEEREEEIPSEIQALAEERAEARKAKDWTRADAIRDQLKEAGYELKDTPEGVKITRV
ncbi:cysteine--tRNA ligase [Christensenellaceae bacterium NSJ-63]|uniref:Cysteine--tRNA ligase n=1 Tax=Guopingia tenuis TaxID=2763656 RepID=A0A926DIG3_9FIRM|nr:cysteine--tRNA ligase [Guopingia tenuis]MBC8537869.1 cysteine--tRNA ligase [Guopingia tenuis]